LNVSFACFPTLTISMTLDPTRALRRKENSLEIDDGKVGHLAGELRVQRLVKSHGEESF
jgi:hypothetical protein